MAPSPEAEPNTSAAATTAGASADAGTGPDAPSQADPLKTDTSKTGTRKAGTSETGSDDAATSATEDLKSSFREALARKAGRNSHVEAHLVGRNLGGGNNDTHKRQFRRKSI